MAALKQSASVFPKVHSVWGHLWDDIGLAPVGQPRAILSSKRLKRLADVWSTVVDGTLTSTSLNNRGFAILLLKQVRILDVTQPLLSTRRIGGAGALVFVHYGRFFYTLQETCLCTTSIVLLPTP